MTLPPHGVDPRTVELVEIGPRATAIAGTPFESDRVIYADEHVELGVWEVTPGVFTGAKDGVCELMHFVAGSGTIIDEEGVVTEIGPGVVLFCPDGWRGTWDVRETVRKTYAIAKTTG